MLPELSTISKGLSQIPKIWNWLRYLTPRIQNSLFVKKYKISVHPNTIEETWEENGRPHKFNRFCLTIEHDSKVDLHINLKKIKINDDIFHGPLWLEQLELEKEQDFCWNQYKKLNLIFGVFPKGGNEQRIRGTKRNSLLLWSTKKNISVTLSVNKKMLEIGTNREEVALRYINYIWATIGTFPINSDKVPARYKSQL